MPDKVRIPLCVQPDSTEESGYEPYIGIKNGYVDTVDYGNSNSRRYVKKRPGIVEKVDTSDASIARGMYYWDYTNRFYFVLGDTLYRYNPSTDTLNSTGTVSNSSNERVSFVEFRSPTLQLVVVSDDHMYQVLTTGAFSEIADGDIPTDLVPGAVNLDNYMFVMDYNGKIYNSDLGDPTSWDPLNFLSANKQPDHGVYLSYMRNQVVAMKSWSTQFFYDAANSSGSPLSPTQGAEIAIGCAGAETVIEYSGEDSIVFVSQTKSGSRSVHMLSGYEVIKISTAQIDRLVASYAGEGEVSCFKLSRGGHQFYCIGMQDFRKYLVFDLYEKRWYFWEPATGKDIRFGASEVGNLASSGLEDYDTNATYAVGYNDGKLYFFDATKGTDDAVEFNFQIDTEIIDFNTHDRKFLHELELIGEYNENASFAVSYSDDDGDNYSTAKNITMNDRRRVQQLGSFRRRKFRLVENSSGATSIDAIELTVDKGRN